MITITGASDDLIEIDGDICQEFNHYPDDENDAVILGFSDGTLLKMSYDKDGIWRIFPLRYGVSEYSKVEGIVADDTNDVVTLNGTIVWVVLGKAAAQVHK